MYRTVLNINQQYKSFDYLEKNNYINSQTVPRLKALLEDTRVLFQKS